jgi:hypothetical protein
VDTGQNPRRHVVLIEIQPNAYNKYLSRTAEPVLRDLKARSPGFLEKSRTFAKSLLKDSNFVGFLRRSRLNDPDEEILPPIGYLFPVKINIFCMSRQNSS